MKMGHNSWLIIINPESAAGKGKKVWPILKSRLEHHSIPYKSEFSNYVGHVEELVKQYYNKGYRKIGILGGDGSLHALANAIMHPEIDSKEVTLALFPAGTGNDWRKTHGLNMKMDPILNLILNDQWVHHDLARVTYGTKVSYFINLMGAGLDAMAVQAYHSKISRLPIGQLKYLVSLFSALVHYKKIQLHLSCDGKSIFNDAILNFNLGIGKFSGGGIMTIPNAIFNDGVLNGVYVKDIAAYKILLNIPNLFNGKYTHLKEVEQFSGSRINLEFTEDQWIEADGELMGPSNKYQIEVLPRVFRIISAA